MNTLVAKKGILKRMGSFRRRSKHYIIPTQKEECEYSMKGPRKKCTFSDHIALMELSNLLPPYTKLKRRDLEAQVVAAAAGNFSSLYFSRECCSTVHFGLKSVPLLLYILCLGHTCIDVDCREDPFQSFAKDAPSFSVPIQSFVKKMLHYLASACDASEMNVLGKYLIDFITTNGAYPPVIAFARRWILLFPVRENKKLTDQLYNAAFQWLSVAIKFPLASSDQPSVEFSTILDDKGRLYNMDVEFNNGGTCNTDQVSTSPIQESICKNPSTTNLPEIQEISEGRSEAQLSFNEHSENSDEGRISSANPSTPDTQEFSSDRYEAQSSFDVHSENRSEIRISSASPISPRVFEPCPGCVQEIYHDLRVKLFEFIADIFKIASSVVHEKKVHELCLQRFIYISQHFHHECQMDRVRMAIATMIVSTFRNDRAFLPVLMLCREIHLSYAYLQDGDNFREVMIYLNMILDLLELTIGFSTMSETVQGEISTALRRIAHSCYQILSKEMSTCKGKSLLLFQSLLRIQMAMMKVCSPYYDPSSEKGCEYFCELILHLWNHALTCVMAGRRHSITTAPTVPTAHEFREHVALKAVSPVAMCQDIIAFSSLVIAHSGEKGEGMEYHYENTLDFLTHCTTGIFFRSIDALLEGPVVNNGSMMVVTTIFEFLNLFYRKAKLLSDLEVLVTKWFNWTVTHHDSEATTLSGGMDSCQRVQFSRMVLECLISLASRSDIDIRKAFYTVGLVDYLANLFQASMETTLDETRRSQVEVSENPVNIDSLKLDDSASTSPFRLNLPVDIIKGSEATRRYSTNARRILPPPGKSVVPSTVNKLRLKKIRNAAGDAVSCHPDLITEELLLILLLTTLVCPDQINLDERYCSQFPTLSTFGMNVLNILQRYLEQNVSRLFHLRRGLQSSSGGGPERLLRLLMTNCYDHSIFMDLKHIASGAFGDVFKCISPINSGEASSGELEDGNVAIKVIDVARRPDQRCVTYDVFAEVSMLEHLRGLPGVAHMYSYGKTTDAYHIVMGCSPISLKSWIAASSRNVKQILDLFYRICKAVQAIHDAGVVHCDLKCDNVMIRPSSTGQDDVFLIDFGEAFPLSSASSSCFELRSRGTEGIKSPEMLFLGHVGKESVKKVGPATDVWSLGCLLYEMIAKEPLFKSENWSEYFCHLTQSSEDMITPMQQMFLKKRLPNEMQFNVILELLHFILIRKARLRPNLYGLSQKIISLKKALEKADLFVFPPTLTSMSSFSSSNSSMSSLSNSSMSSLFGNEDGEENKIDVLEKLTIESYGPKYIKKECVNMVAKNGVMHWKKHTFLRSVDFGVLQEGDVTEYGYSRSHLFQLQRMSYKQIIQIVTNPKKQDYEPTRCTVTKLEGLLIPTIRIQFVVDSSPSSCFSGEQKLMDQTDLFFPVLQQLLFASDKILCIGNSIPDVKLLLPMFSALLIRTFDLSPYEIHTLVQDALGSAWQSDLASWNPRFLTWHSHRQMQSTLPYYQCWCGQVTFHVSQPPQPFPCSCTYHDASSHPILACSQIKAWQKEHLFGTVDTATSLYGHCTTWIVHPAYHLSYSNALYLQDITTGKSSKTSTVYPVPIDSIWQLYACTHCHFLTHAKHQDSYAIITNLKTYRNQRKRFFYEHV